MQSVSDNLAVVYMTTAVNQEIIESRPPNLPFQVEDPAHRKELLDNAKHGAGQYDMYKNIVQLSFLVKIKGHALDGSYIHLMHCENQDASMSELSRGYSKIITYNTEEGLAAGLKVVLEMIAGVTATQGFPMGAVPTIAGWKINTDIWPMLVNFMIAHKYPIHDWWKTDPTARYSTVKGLLDVSNIYSQGVSMTMRRLPALSDTLRYWGVGTEFDEPMDIARAVCDNPEAVVGKVEPYLIGMYDIIRRYHGEESKS